MSWKFILITSPIPVEDEIAICNLLFDNGLEILHLRKPEESREVYEHFLQGISPCYRKRIVIHDHYELAGPYGLKGIHLRSGQAGRAKEYAQLSHISISCHRLEEIYQLPFKAAYCFLSPIFDSLSKPDYPGHFSPEELIRMLPDCKQEVIALGGITPSGLERCRSLGFQGAAVLGYIWNQPCDALMHFHELTTPVVMSIAGFDPSSGAGVSADLKTFENCKTYGLGIASAITFQNEDEYTGTHWIPQDEIIRQCELQFQKSRPTFIKIGLVEDFTLLSALIDFLHRSIPGVKIIWDPIIKASAGFTFHKEKDKLQNILKRIYLITPNTPELKFLFGDTCDEKILQQISASSGCSILWKGGHGTEANVCDRLISPEGIFSTILLREPYDKHGTGCVLSSAITAFLAAGVTLPEACSQAQVYVSRFMNSNTGKLGYHHTNTPPVFPKPTPAELNVQYISDHKDGMTVCEQIEAVCRGGIKWVQLRMKECEETEMLRVGKLVKAICQRHHVLLIINDNVNIARQLDADGVHLGKEDMDPREARRLLGHHKIIGATCNTFEDILLRRQQAVDYVGLGPFTYTTTKKKLSPVLGLEGYRQIIRQMKESNIHLPVYAIGGICNKDIPALMQTGIQGIALSGLIKNDPDITAKAREIIEILDSCSENKPE